MRHNIVGITCKSCNYVNIIIKNVNRSVLTRNTSPGNVNETVDGDSLESLTSPVGPEHQELQVGKSKEFE